MTIYRQAIAVLECVMQAEGTEAQEARAQAEAQVSRAWRRRTLQAAGGRRRARQARGGRAA